jgi:competence protein ComGC
MNKVKQYFIITVVILLLLFVPNSTLAEEQTVCISGTEAVDIITLLDASERDIELLNNCEKLVKDLYTEIERKDTKINNLTKELITARQDVIEYKEKNKTLRKITWYAVGGSVIITVVNLLPALL